jgi:hypothetical protein
MSEADIEIPFVHNQSSHCESGVASNLLNHYGLEISEAMAFGIGEGLFFGYLPFIRVNRLPLTTYRCAGGAIFNRLTRRLGVTVRSQTFRNEQKAMAALDAKLDQGIPVGCRTGAFWLPYFPEAFRFHFNMHNLVVYGKKGDDYLISDPVFPEPVVCPANRLRKARFAKGTLAPKGYMYHIERVPEEIDLAGSIKTGIRGVCRAMLKARLPLIGISGIRFFANRLERWPEKLGQERAMLHLGQVIRMQEEIGTGGAGFRFMYAAFLQEAAEFLRQPSLADLSRQLTDTGDRWRRFALLGSRMCKGRVREGESYSAMADIIRECADREAQIYQALMKAA